MPPELWTLFARRPAPRQDKTLETLGEAWPLTAHFAVATRFAAARHAAKRLRPSFGAAPASRSGG